MYLFNYYYLQWHTDTNKLLKFTNLHDLSAFGNYLHYMHGTNTTLGFLYRNVLTFCQRISAYLRAKKRSLSFLRLQFRSPYTLNPCGRVLSLSRLLSLEQPYVQITHTGFFFVIVPRELLSSGSHVEDFFLGIQGGTSDLSVGCSAIFIKVVARGRKENICLC